MSRTASAFSFVFALPVGPLSGVRKRQGAEAVNPTSDSSRSAMPVCDAWDDVFPRLRRLGVVLAVFDAFDWLVLARLLTTKTCLGP